MNPRGAKLQFNGPDDKANTDVLIARHSNIIFRGFEVNCTAENGNHTWDCVQVNGWDNNNTEAQNILIENIYAHDSGHSLFGCFRARNVEVRNSTFDMSAHDSEYGEGLYLTSSKRAGSNKPCHNLDFHHNLVGRFGGNSVDFKSQTRNCIVRDSIFLDKRIQIDTTDQGGDGDFISQNPQNGTRLAGNYTRDTISYRVIPAYVWKASDGHRMDFITDNSMIYKEF